MGFPHPLPEILITSVGGTARVPRGHQGLAGPPVGVAGGAAASGGAEEASPAVARRRLEHDPVAGSQVHN